MSPKLPKIFLDSSDPQETKKAKALLGFLDGQTTNPSLVAKNPEIQKYLESGKKLTEKDLLGMYKDLIQAIEKETAGALSVETYADWNTTASEMLAQAEDMTTWGKNIYIKFPTIPAGVEAAHEFVKKGGRVNMTLVFDQNQAASVYSATLETQQSAFISPFIGRWDDRGFNGLDLVKNIIKMYKHFDEQRNKHKCHVQVLAASIRSMEHFYASMFLGADILTVPMKIIYEWIEDEKRVPDSRYRIKTAGLHSLIYQDLHFKPDYKDFPIENNPQSLLSEGLEKFVADWKKLIAK